MVKSLNELGGTHTEEDFYNQNTIISDTLISNYKDNYINQCPPNGPGVNSSFNDEIIRKFDWKNIFFRCSKISYSSRSYKSMF